MNYQAGSSRKISLPQEFPFKITFNNHSKADQKLLPSIKDSVNLIKVEDLTDQFFHQNLNRQEVNNKSTVQYFKGLNHDGRVKLEKYCLKQFNQLSLFLMFQLSWQLGLQELSKMCTNQFINQNYEQLNYCKYDMMKCSFYAFKKILDEYKALSKSLQIQGLKQSDLKSIINDYCMTCSIDSQQRANLLNQFVNVHDTLLVNQNKGSQIRRSMMQPNTKSKMQLSVPVKPKNALNLLARTPTLGSDDWSEIQDEGKQRNRTKSQQQKQQNKQDRIQKSIGKNLKKNIKTQKNSNSISQQQKLNFSAQLHKQIEQLKQKQSLLKSQIHQTRQSCNNQDNQKYLKESFEKLQKKMVQMENQLQVQNQLIKGLLKSATDIRESSGGNKKLDCVFSF